MHSPSGCSKDAVRPAFSACTFPVPAVSGRYEIRLVKSNMTIIATHFLFPATSHIYIPQAPAIRPVCVKPPRIGTLSPDICEISVPSSFDVAAGGIQSAVLQRNSFSIM
jgi:hypothetical protein